jgi:hypothetical protein
MVQSVTTVTNKDTSIMKKEEKKKIGGIADKSMMKVAEAKQVAKVPAFENNVSKPLPVAQPAGSNYE